MSSRTTAVAVAIVAIGSVAAQDVFPTLDFFHTWQYGLLLALVAWALGVSAYDALRRGADEGGRAIGIALAGALVVAGTGIASGLLGPDTARLIRAPGTIAPIPDIGAAAFFAGVDPAAIEAGTATVTLRRRGKPDVVVGPGTRKYFGASVLLLEPRPVAYIDASDMRGNHLTITQPTSSSFLSPVLLFREEQPIAGATHRIDGFTLPAVQREVKVVYFTTEQALSLPEAARNPGSPVLLFAVFAGGLQGTPQMAVAQSAQTVTVDGVRIRATLGVYPQLVVASAPEPWALALGVLMFAGGLIASRTRRPPVPAPAGKPAPAPRRKRRA